MRGEIPFIRLMGMRVNGLIYEWSNRIVLSKWMKKRGFCERLKNNPIVFVFLKDEKMWDLYVYVCVLVVRFLLVCPRSPTSAPSSSMTAALAMPLRITVGTPGTYIQPLRDCCSPPLYISVVVLLPPIFPPVLVCMIKPHFMGCVVVCGIVN